MANVFAKIEKYMQNAIDTVFAEDSKTKILEIETDIENFKTENSLSDKLENNFTEVYFSNMMNY